MRATVSVAEPAGKGTTKRIGLVGYCAAAVWASVANNSEAISLDTALRMSISEGHFFDELEAQGKQE
jgi:dienelactone hydrolase